MNDLVITTSGRILFWLVIAFVFGLALGIVVGRLTKRSTKRVTLVGTQYLRPGRDSVWVPEMADFREVMSVETQGGGWLVWVAGRVAPLVVSGTHVWRTRRG